MRNMDQFSNVLDAKFYMCLYLLWENIKISKLVELRVSIQGINLNL